MTSIVRSQSITSVPRSFTARASALVGSVVVALLVGMGSQVFATHTRADLNTVLAVFWTAAFAAGLMILEYLTTHVDLENFLFGNILGISDFDLWFSYGAGFIVLSVVILLQRSLTLMMFSPDIASTQGIPVKRLDFLFAGLLVIVMITSLQAVGVLLALGMLVGPAAIMDLFAESPRKILWGGGVLGAVIAFVSVFLSNWFNVQTGALILIVLGCLFLLSLVFSPRHGLLARIFRHHVAPHA